MAEGKTNKRRAPAKQNGSRTKSAAAKKTASKAKSGSGASKAKTGSGAKRASGGKRASAATGRSKAKTGTAAKGRAKSASGAKAGGAAKTGAAAKAASGAKARARGKTGAGAKATRPSPPAKSVAVEQTARSYGEALGRRDAAATAAHFHPDGVDDIVPLGIYRGPSEVRALFTELLAAVPDFYYRVERVVADDRVAAVEYRMGGTFEGAPYRGIEPTGKSLELRGCDLMEIEDGKIVRNTGYYDGAAFARGIGLLPPQDSGAERAMTGALNFVTRARRVVTDRKLG